MDETFCSCTSIMFELEPSDSYFCGSFIDNNDNRVFYFVYSFICSLDKYHNFIFNSYPTPFQETVSDISLLKKVESSFFFNAYSTDQEILSEWGSIEEKPSEKEIDRREFDGTIAIKSIISIRQSHTKDFKEKRVKLIINPGKKMMKEMKEKIESIKEDEEKKIRLLEELLKYKKSQ